VPEFGPSVGKDQEGRESFRFFHRLRNEAFPPKLSSRPSALSLTDTGEVLFAILASFWLGQRAGFVA
jgi:hypothetical protein